MSGYRLIGANISGANLTRRVKIRGLGDDIH